MNDAVKSLRERLADRRLSSKVDDFDYVFVVAVGRSGSTLVQTLLNSIPGWYLRGENAGFVLRQVESLWVLRETKQRNDPKSADQIHPWFGVQSVDLPGLARDIRRTSVIRVMKPPAESRVVGFKEIRWGWDCLDQNLLAFREVFPDARFVLNVRNPEAIAQSGWWPDRPNSLQHITGHIDAIEKVAEVHPDFTYLIRYESYTSEPEALKPLFEWLGEAWDEKSIRQVLDRRLTH